MSVVIPDACTLPTAQRPLRLAEFESLFATAVRSVERIDPRQVRLHLAGEAGLEGAVRDLTDRESQCCSFFTFVIAATDEVTAGSLTLDISVPSEYAEVLEALAQRASTQSRGRSA